MRKVVDLAEEKKTSASSTEEAVREAVKEAREEAKQRQEAASFDGTETEVEETLEPESESDSEMNSEAQEESQDQVEATRSSKKGFFQKKKDPRDEKIAELTDRVTRQMAEFDNFRKRTEKEKSASFELGASSVLEKILPVVDNFERGLALIPEGEADAFADGMDKIYKQLLKTMADLGVTPIEALGQPFDPDLHNAVMHVEDESIGENVVVEELQKGYKYHDRVLRHSMVKVAN